VTMKPLEGKVALITGGSSGIGRATALLFAKAGASIAITARSTAPLEETARDVSAAGTAVSFHPGDVSDPTTVEKVVADVIARHGAIDILINNAAVEGPTGPLHKIEPAAWDEVMAANLRGSFLYTRMVAPLMIERKTGRIVYISALAGGLRALPGQAPLAVSKAGVLALMKSAAVELGPYGIMVNAVTPGPVLGERFGRVAKRQAKRDNIAVATVEQNMSARTPSRRIQSPDDVAETLLFLCTTKANIMGQSINVTGGMEL
jgi:NAD(P)-dependent dehydrogenase (short-subunit alcohol dehydrogenase family)